MPIASQQLIEIAKALGREARVIVMDEPTSALSAPEVEKLIGLVEHVPKLLELLRMAHKLRNNPQPFSCSLRSRIFRELDCLGNVLLYRADSCQVAEL